MKNNIRDFFLYSSSQVVMIIFSIITSAIWARYSTQEEYGIFQLFMSFIIIAGVFNLPGLGMSMQLSSANNKNKNLAIALKIKLKYSIISSIFLLFIGFYFYFYKENILISYLLFISSFLYPIYILSSLWESWLTGIRKIKKLSFILILNSFISLSVVSFGLIYMKSITFTIFVLFLSIAILNIIILRFFTIENKTLIEDKSLINYGYAFSGAVIISMLVGLDKFIISEYLSLSDVAIYGVAMTFVLKIKILYATINKLISPSILKAKDITMAWQYIKYKMILIWIGFILIGIIGFIFVDDIIVLIFTDKYEQSAMYAKWLWLIVSISRPILYLSSILKAQKKLKFAYYLESINSIGKLVLLIVLLPFYHLWGMVYATLIVNFTALVYISVYFYIEYQKEIKGGSLQNV
jgi:O-antigen/teichoic acid export membrane protein